MDHPKSCGCASKKIAALSLLVAVQTTSCVSNKGQGVTALGKPCYGYWHQLPASQGKVLDSVKLEELQKKTRKILSEESPDFNGQNAFFEAVKKCNFLLVKSLIQEYPSITSKEVVKALMLALKHKDTLSFRYKHEKIVHFLLKEHTPALEDLYMQDETGSTVLHLLIKRGDINALRFLAEKLPLKGLLMKDKKCRTPMHLTARYKSPKMFRIVFARIIDKLDADRAIAELFKTCKRGSVFSCAYLRKHSDFAELLNNSKVQISTVFVQGSKMFKTILDALPVRLDLEQLNTIVREIDDIQDGYIISKQYGAELRGIVWSYIKKQYPIDSDKVIQYVAYIRHLSYIEEKYGSDSKDVRDYVAQRKKLVSYIKNRYGSKIYQDVSKDNGDSEPDEGYGSGLETSHNESILTS